MNIDTQTYNKETLYPNPEGYGPNKRQLITAIVIHTTNGQLGNALRSEARFLYTSKAVSTHYLVGKLGEIIQFLDPLWIAWHAGTVNDTDCSNDHSIGIENHVTVGEQWTALQHAALTELVASLLRAYPTITKIVTHRSIAIFASGPRKGQLGRKIDPSGWDDSAFGAWRAELLIGHIPSSTIDSSGALFAPESASKERASEYITIRQHGEYTSVDITTIITAYYAYAKLVGLDAALLVAQMIHETGCLTSWWAARPRRNPAGLGVTGQTTRIQPAGAWAFDPVLRYWKKGYSFPTWQDAIRAHVGHILCYALADHEMNTVQLAMSSASPRKANLPTSYRGCAKNIRDLNGKWAVPGTTYGQRIIAIAKAF